MEKITYPPLIEHLRERSDFYNQLYLENEIKYGPVNSVIISSWMVQVIEPILKEVTASNPDLLPQVFKALFAELLHTLGNQSGIIYENEHQSAWRLCSKMPALVSQFPARLLKAINSAISSIRIHQPEKVIFWITLMENGVSHCQSIEEFLAFGRIYAWLSGMAHLRARATEEFSNLRSELKQVLRDNFSDANIEEAIQSKWPHLNQPQFVGEAGGFVGYGGFFTAPPIVSLIDNKIFVTDQKSSCAFFADKFGKVLLSEVPIPPEKIIRSASAKDLSVFVSKYNKELIPFNDVTSCVLKYATLVLTRASSHYLYVFGWKV